MGSAAIPIWCAILTAIGVPTAAAAVLDEKFVIKAVKVDALSPDEAASERMGLHRVLAALGLLLPATAGEETAEAPAEIAALAEARRAAKAAKDWPEADRLRNEISALGWEVKDTKEGYELCPKN